MYKEKRKQSLEVRSLRKDVDSIRQDMVELKIMVRQVMERLNDWTFYSLLRECGRWWILW